MDRSDPPSFRPPAGGKSSAGHAAVIGPSIAIRGDLTGEEDLVIEGRVEGEVTLEKHCVEVGQGGRVKADIHAKNIHVLGQVDGNLTGDEAVIIRASGRVAGNITAPRVTLEDGCNFRGSVDMNPGKKKVEAPAPSPTPSLGKDAKDGRLGDATKPTATATGSRAAAGSPA